MQRNATPEGHRGRNKYVRAPILHRASFVLDTSLWNPARLLYFFANTVLGFRSFPNMLRVIERTSKYTQMAPECPKCSQEAPRYVLHHVPHISSLVDRGSCGLMNNIMTPDCDHYLHVCKIVNIAVRLNCMSV